MFRRLFVAFSCLALLSPLTLRTTHAAPPEQGPIVVNAVDNDPENKLWNCDIGTSRTTFGNEETDRSRCFTFRSSAARWDYKRSCQYQSEHARLASRHRCNGHGGWQAVPAVRMGVRQDARLRGLARRV